MRQRPVRPLLVLVGPEAGQALRWALPSEPASAAQQVRRSAVLLVVLLVVWRGLS